MPLNNEEFQQAFAEGRLIAYPTEAVFGLGCDPDNETAVMALLALKQRPLEKGLILIARDYSQLLPYVNDKAIAMDKRSGIFSSWPGPITWLLPAAPAAPKWLTGGSDLIAVRVTAFPLVRELCTLVDKPLVSTSANLSGKPPAKTAEEVAGQFADEVFIVSGETGGRQNPSEIRHGITGELIRAS